MGVKFNEKIRERIFGSYISTSSSGSDHDGESDVVVSPFSCTSTSSSPSLCLSDLVQNFLEPDSDSTREFGSDSDSDEILFSDPTPLIISFINPIVRSNADPFWNKLLGHVTKAVEIFSVFRQNRPVFHRNVMTYLRENGYNSGVCKTRWNSSGAAGGIPAGSYEFIDVLRQGETPASVRYIIDVEFSGEFEIARETERYSILRSSLPRVFVAKSDDLKRIVRFMCDESKKSMKISGLSLPPWRKNRYIIAKWLGSYRRTTNHLSVAAVVSSAVVSNFGVKCRSVGFDLAGDGCRMFVPPATKTR